MADLSTAAALSRIYTNHCIRATTTTNLSRAGYEGRFIRQISGHSSDASLTHYCQQMTNEQKRHMSVSLMNSAGVLGAPLEQPASTSRSLNASETSVVNYNIANCSVKIVHR